MALFPSSPPPGLPPPAPDAPPAPVEVLPPAVEGLPPTNPVVTNTTIDPLRSHSDRHPSVAGAWAKEHGYFATDLITEVRTLAAKGLQPLHVEGPKSDRPHKLFVYDLTPENAKELLHG